MKIDYQKELNQEQYAVVTEGDGPCLVLAGAGSGKTRTLVYRVAWLLEHGVDPRQIMLVTFTNKAAREMLNRVELLAGKKVRGLFGGTFHHLGNTLLRNHADRLGYTKHFTILDRDDSRTLMKSVLPHERTYLPKADVIVDLWSFVRNSQMSFDDVWSRRFSHIPEEQRQAVEGILVAYEEKKKKSNAMDFDDLLLNWRRLLAEHSDIRQALARQFRSILVDEYQDTNPIQGGIVTTLAEQHKNILVVGDDSQSIYSFRAATVDNILDFPKQFQNVKTFRLETNYRSTPEILHLANASIRSNARRHEKKLRSVKKSGVLPTILMFRDADEQASWIADRILECREEGTDLKDIAVLFRSTYHMIELELEINKRQIPYVVRGGLRFFEQAHIKDVIAYLKVLANPNDEISAKRILLMEEGIGPVKADQLWQLRTFPPRLEKIFAQLRALDNELLKKGVETILASGYEEYAKATFENFEERRDDLEQFAVFAGRYSDLQTLLSDVSLSEGFRRDRIREDSPLGPRGLSSHDDVLVLSTIHQAKGLEWKVVFVIGLAEGQFPHYKVYKHPHELEEERRLFYVAVTRAKDQLYLTYSMMNQSVMTSSYMNAPSRFLTELPDEVYKRMTPEGDTVDDREEVIQLEGEESVLDRVMKLSQKK